MVLVNCNVLLILFSKLLSTRPPTLIPGKTPDQKQEYQLEGHRQYQFPLVYRITKPSYKSVGRVLVGVTTAWFVT